jgi:hypothetical protein
MRRFREIGPQQRTSTRQRILRGAVGLCYGACARPFEVADTIGNFVEKLDGVVVVHIPGQFARIVPVLPDVADDLLDLARQLPDSCIFSDRKPKTDWMRDTLTNVEVPDWYRVRLAAEPWLVAFPGGPGSDDGSELAEKHKNRKRRPRSRALHEALGQRPHYLRDRETRKSFADFGRRLVPLLRLRTTPRQPG